MATYSLCEQLRITPIELKTRLDFLKLTEHDQANLAAIGRVIRDQVDSIIEEFYTHLSQYQELATFLSDPQTLERLKNTQRDYLLTLGQGIDTLEYCEDRLRIGFTHERVGLHQKWSLGAFSILFRMIAQHLTIRYADEQNIVPALLITLQKILTFDEQLVVETYYAATTQRLEGLLQQVADAQHQLQETSRLDHLTQVLNRKSLMEALEVKVHRSRRFEHPFSLLFLDIDHFKPLNDNYGHGFGDNVLRAVAEQIQKMVRPADVVGRFGGEEFVIGLVEAADEASRLIAERIQLKIALTQVADGQQSASVTVSIGLATLTPQFDRLDTLIKQADQAMYKAKAAGRNQVSIFQA